MVFFNVIYLDRLRICGFQNLCRNSRRKKLTKKADIFIHLEDLGTVLLSGESVKEFSPRTVVFYMRNPPKMVSIQVGEFLYPN